MGYIIKNQKIRDFLLATSIAASLSGFGLGLYSHYLEKPTKSAIVEKHDTYVKEVRKLELQGRYIENPSIKTEFNMVISQLEENIENIENNAEFRSYQEEIQPVQNIKRKYEDYASILMAYAFFGLSMQSTGFRTKFIGRNR